MGWVTFLRLWHEKHSGNLKSVPILTVTFIMMLQAGRYDPLHYVFPWFSIR